MKAAEIRERLNTAVALLNQKDRYLLQNDLSERCIAARLAMYLQSVFPDHVVDVEYNRAGDIPEAAEPARRVRQLPRRGRTLISRAGHHRAHTRSQGTEPACP